MTRSATTRALPRSLAMVIFGISVSGTLLAISGAVTLAVIGAIWYVAWYAPRRR
jgi:integral membrane sensor domain MASE1